MNTAENPPETLCLLRLSAIGDVCHAVAVVQLIQRHYPRTKITWVIGKTEYALLAGLPNIEFIVFDKSRGWRAYWDLWRTCRQRHFDVLLHMQVAMRANLASCCIRATTRVGFDKARARDGHQYFINTPIKAVAEQHVLDGFLEFAQAIGIDDRQVSWSVPIAPEDKAFAAKTMNGKPTLLINPAASFTFKNWHVGGYAEVARYAIDTHHLQVILIGGPTDIEKQLGEAITEQVPDVINLIGKTTLKQCLAVIAAADVLVAPDTGPTHMATMVNTPTIGLYATCDSRRTGPYNRAEYCVDKYQAAAIKVYGEKQGARLWGKRLKDPSLMSLITPDEVLAKLERIMQTEPFNASHHCGSPENAS